ncbi:type VI secretion system contractile sheath small subunit [Archangium primigenium]|uniref:type VI secretion system contractile sheath small subunit n=1 Tax=[Archangium] primigenium TaxID=2792470 RepID=UPI00195B6EA1|nr:type VI secretion system contractile sheath small subunit [Archangium primigenium]
MSIQDKLPKSRITLKYRTTINGQKEDVKLPFRMVVLGDFSQGSSTDRQADLDERQTRSVTGSNINDLMRDMGMSLSLEVTDKVSADGQGKMNIQLPITGIKSFNPDEIVNHVPKLQALMLLRKLLMEMQADIDNRKELRRTIYELFSNKEQLQKMLESDELKSYVSMRLPKTARAQSSGQPALPADNTAAAKA